MNYPTTTRSIRVADEVRAEMARSRVTGTTLAQSVGMSNATLSRRLSGAIPFNLDELSAVATRLGLTVTELLARAERGDAA
jgi:hypothetical protein